VRNVIRALERIEDLDALDLLDLPPLQVRKLHRHPDEFGHHIGSNAGLVPN